MSPSPPTSSAHSQHQTLSSTTANFSRDHLRQLLVDMLHVRISSFLIIQWKLSSRRMTKSSLLVCTMPILKNKLFSIVSTRKLSVLSLSSLSSRQLFINPTWMYFSFSQVYPTLPQRQLLVIEIQQRFSFYSIF